MTKFEHAEPILRVSNLAVSVRYYTEALGFVNAEWGTDNFTLLSRDGAGIYLCQGSQGHPGTWAWIGVEDVDALYREYAIIPRAITHGRWKSMSRIQTGRAD